MPEVGRWEPPLALFGELDGLAVIRRLIDDVKAPFLALEHGEGQGDAIEALVREAGFDEVERIPDLAGIERVLVGRRAT
jgi:release factor glutamine methyltransferase